MSTYNQTGGKYNLGQYEDLSVQRFVLDSSILKSDSIDLQCYAGQVFYAISTKAGHTISWIHITP